MAVERVRKPPAKGVSLTTGSLATAAWCLARGLFPAERTWFAEIELFAGVSRFAIEIFAEEWGYSLRHAGRVSWIRVTEIPFVHGQDELELLRETSSFSTIGRVLRGVEKRFELAFAREAAIVHTNIAGGEPAIRAWVATL